PITEPAGALFSGASAGGFERRRHAGIDYSRGRRAAGNPGRGMGPSIRTRARARRCFGGAEVVAYRGYQREGLCSAGHDGPVRGGRRAGGPWGLPGVAAAPVPHMCVHAALPAVLGNLSSAVIATPDGPRAAAVIVLLNRRKHPPNEIYQLYKEEHSPPLPSP